MALPRGSKPKPTALRLIGGNAGHRPIPQGEPMPTGRPKPPIKMTGRPAALWRKFISPAFWLTEFDSPKAWLFCQLQAEAEKSVAAITAARIGQLRALGSELGFDPAARARLGGNVAPAKPSKARDYF